MPKKKREILSVEQLDANYKKFIKGKKPNPDGKATFERAVKRAVNDAKPPDSK